MRKLRNRSGGLSIIEPPRRPMIDKNGCTLEDRIRRLVLTQLPSGELKVCMTQEQTDDGVRIRLEMPIGVRTVR